MTGPNVFDLSHSMAPPRLWVSQTRIFRTATFEVRLPLIPSCWWAPSDVFGGPNVIVACSSATPSPVQQGDELVFVFDVCRTSVFTPTYCNSSRLHLGGKVVLLVEIVDTRGAVLQPQPQQSTEEEIPLSFSPLFAGFLTPRAAEPPAPAAAPPGRQAEQAPGQDQTASDVQQAAGAATNEPELIARQMGELERMRQENLARVILLQRLLVLALAGSRPT
eukprot:m51a1_g4451 hypothetical protein (220) ;mRNA; f:157906-159037